MVTIYLGHCIQVRLSSSTAIVPLIQPYFSYVATLSLSLFLFNLLPLPFLDGSQLLDALADLLSAHASQRAMTAALADAELGEPRSEGSASSRVHGARYRRLKKGVQMSIGLMLLVTMFAALWCAVL